MSISLKNIYISINDILIIKDLSLQVDGGEFCLIGGESGIGKTTLLNVVSGLKKPDQGEIFLNDKTLNSKNKFVLPEKRNIGYVFQDFALFPHINVYKNITFASENISKDLFSKTIEALKLEEHINKMPYQLSGGLQQRAAIARAIMMKPSLLLLDEPCSNLDAQNSDSVQSILSWYAKEFKVACLIVSHDFEMFDKINVSKNIVLSEI
tara:strand:+ start:381 stop:1007 length:627 start_codon:yes stop_codon:yes gene_type:complete